jgi:hypothetical protein
MMADGGWQPKALVICACGHDLEQHDRVGARYCAATSSSRLDRGCVCVTEESAAALASAVVVR